MNDRHELCSRLSCAAATIQELPTDVAIQGYAYDKAGLPRPPQAVLFSKGHVNGPQARSAWVLLKQQTGASDPTWNFKVGISPCGIV